MDPSLARAHPGQGAGGGRGAGGEDPEVLAPRRGNSVHREGRLAQPAYRRLLHTPWGPEVVRRRLPAAAGDRGRSSSRTDPNPGGGTSQGSLSLGSWIRFGQAAESGAGGSVGSEDGSRSGTVGSPSVRRPGRPPGTG